MVELSTNFSKLKILDCSFTKINKIPSNYLNLERLNCKCSNIKDIPDTLIKLIYLNCNFTSIKTLSPNFINLQILKIKHTLIKRLSYKYKSLIKLQIYNNIYFSQECIKYITINFLLFHFKTKFKFINKFKFIKKQSLLAYQDYILDKYINPYSLSLRYKIYKWSHNSTYCELLYLSESNELKIYKLIK